MSLHVGQKLTTGWHEYKYHGWLKTPKICKEPSISTVAWQPGAVQWQPGSTSDQQRRRHLIGQHNLNNLHNRREEASSTVTVPSFCINMKVAPRAFEIKQYFLLANYVFINKFTRYNYM